MDELKFMPINNVEKNRQKRIKKEREELGFSIKTKLVEIENFQQMVTLLNKEDDILNKDTLTDADIVELKNIHSAMVSHTEIYLDKLSNELDSLRNKK